MAVLADLHVVLARVGGKGKKVNINDIKSIDILNSVIWSETVATGGVSTNAVPNGVSDEGDPVWYLIAARNGWVSFGESGGTPSTNPRIFIRASDPPLVLFARATDKIKFLHDS